MHSETLPSFHQGDTQHKGQSSPEAPNTKAKGSVHSDAYSETFPCNAGEEVQPSEVTLRQKRSSQVGGQSRTSSGGSLSCPSNKRNATYLNEDEYDEDLAQLDMLLHYVNNLSASLEFLQWENKRISTDLVPTLLTMYDALYARLSEDSSNTTYTSKTPSIIPSKSQTTKADENANSKRATFGSLNGDTNSSYPYNSELFIREDGDVVKEKKADQNAIQRHSNQVIPAPLVCRDCERIRHSNTECECSKRRKLHRLSSKGSNNNINNNNNNNGSLYHILDTRLSIENDYDIPEDIENPSDDDVTSDVRLCRSSPVTTTRPSSLTKSTLSQNNLASTDKPSCKTGSPLLGSRFIAARQLDPRKFKQQNSSRPLSSISSSSSSSSSSNSLPRCPAPALAYLASAESLETEEDPTGPEATRRRDRSLKSRREKSLRAGSDDSGVQCHSISLPAPPTLRPRYCDPNLNYMDRVVLEIVETEEGYVKDLKEVIEGYLKHWRTNPQHGISLETVENLFSNIEQIYEFNRRFLNELDLCGSDPVLVARCFVRNNSGFTIYTDYCTNYPKTVDVLTKMMQREESVQACRERQLSLSHTLPLGSYLLKPVQRVLKYHLLLGNILKHFEKDRPGHADIVNALSTMTGMAHHINDMKRKHEHSVRVQEIQSLLIDWPGNDLTTYGELAAEGTFRMHGVKGLRHVFLFDKMLLFTKKKDENILLYKTHIMCSNLMLIESIPREPLSFHVIPFDCPRLQYTLECRNLEQKREWTLQLKRVMIENFSVKIPAHAKQLVMELGQAKPEEGSVLESRGGGGGGSRKTHHAPEYLERRKDRRRTSELGLNSRLRLRRSSRARKDKEQKSPRSRSASRNRDTEEELDPKVATESAEPEKEKSKLKLPMWRRRSEPHIRLVRDSGLSTPEISPHPSPNPGANVTSLSSREVEEPSKRPSSTCFQEKDTSRLSIPSQERIALPLTPDCEKETGDEEPAESENVEHVISQLLQHHFQLQQSILNKHRRHLIRTKKTGAQYETSDTETEDSFNIVPPLPTSPPPPLMNESNNPPKYDVNDLNDFSIIYDACKDGEDVNSTSGWNSDAISICSSVTSVNTPGDYEMIYCSNSQSTLNLGSSKQDIRTKVSNYDNLLNVWGCGRRDMEVKVPPGPRSLEVDQVKKILRRVQSFGEETGVPKDCQEPSRKSSCPFEGSNDSFGISVTKEDNSNRERPVTIAIIDSNTDAFDVLEKYLSNSTKKSEKGKKFPVLANAKTEASTDIASSVISVPDAVNVHPEHKIYSKASVNKGSIRKILSKISLPKSPLSKSTAEPPTFPSSLILDDDRSTNRKTSNLVSSMARHCSRTIKEKIKQITAEDLEKDKNQVSTPDSDKSVNINIYKPNGASIGARLANKTENPDYAVPNLRSEKVNRCDVRPDSVLSTSSAWTSSSSSSSNYSNTLFKRNDKDNLFDISDVIEEIERSPDSSPPLSDVSGDNFYENSFDAIETILENELFRDSAIYSDPEDECSSSKGPSRGGTLSPKSSFRIANYIRSEDIIKKGSILLNPEDYPEKVDFPPINPESTFIKSLTPNEEPVEEPTVSPIAMRLQGNRKVPPPVPTKPADGPKGKRIRGSLIQKQLKNLEDCTKFPKDGNLDLDFDGFKSLDERRKQLSCSAEKRISGKPLSPCSPYSPSVTIEPGPTEVEEGGPKFTPQESGGCSVVEGDIVMARGWVKHVVGKLQYS